jgi:hypothetical protein
MARKDLAGQKFNKLMVIQYAGTKGGYAFWECLCDCGRSAIIKGTYLTRNHTKSCGCLSTEAAINMTKRRIAEGKNIKQKIFNISDDLYKSCNGCKQTLPVESFIQINETMYLHKCNECENKRIASWRTRCPDKSKRILNKYKESDKGKLSIRNSTLSRYGITESEYKDMLQSQDSVCKICHKPNSSGKSLHVDHDHATGELRGLLCQKCNMLLGCANDSIDVLKSAIEYLHIAKSGEVSINENVH